MKALTLSVLSALALLASTAAAPAAPSLSCTVTIWVQGDTFTGRVTRTVNTSCPFARRVTAASLRYIIVHGGSGDGDFYVRVYSPVTHRVYRMHCFADGDIDYDGVHVDCRGGINARIFYIAHRS